jgi:hypothetical protein
VNLRTGIKTPPRHRCHNVIVTIIIIIIIVIRVLGARGSERDETGTQMS